MDREPRREIAGRAADSLEKARARLADATAVSGFDGFVDTILHVASRRTGPGSRDYERLAEMKALAKRIDAAAGRSANFELVAQRVKVGGNGAIMASALAHLGAPTTYIGNIGADNRRGLIERTEQADAVFHDFARRCGKAYTVGPPAHTDAVEFDDGKLLLGKLGPIECVTWEAVLEAVGGVDGFARLLTEAGILSAGNWTMLFAMNRIWEGLRDEVLPRVKALGGRGPRLMFVDLADPAKRSDEDLREGMRLLGGINTMLPVTLGLNRAETMRLAQMNGVAHALEEGEFPENEAVVSAAEGIRAALRLDCVVAHHRRGACAVREGSWACFEGPFTRMPQISTGAGDHFNAGFSFASALGLRLDETLATAAGVSGWYVRKGGSPGLGELIGFLRALPNPDR